MVQGFEHANEALKQVTSLLSNADKSIPTCWLTIVTIRSTSGGKYFNATNQSDTSSSRSTPSLLPSFCTLLVIRYYLNTSSTSGFGAEIVIKQRKTNVILALGIIIIFSLNLALCLALSF